MKTQQRENKKFESPLPAVIASCPVTALSSCIYTSAISARNFLYDNIPSLPRDLGRPTISVGGIRAGGVGKTPAAQMVGRYLIDKCGCVAAFLSRGYGRVAKRTVVVKPHEEADWEETGDEPCMIHNNIPESWLGIGADRTAVARALLPSLPDKSVFILDDGFQRRQTRRDLDIVCLSESTFDDRMIPQGYLREPVSSLARADIILVIGAEDRVDKLREVKERVAARFARGRCAVTAVLVQCPVAWVNAATGEAVSVGAEPPLKNPVAISGIARPTRFIGMLRSLSVEPSDVRIFADHHKFKKYDFALDRNIYYMNEVNSAVTTEKDFVRLRSSELADAGALWYLKIGLRFTDTESEALVLSKINNNITFNIK